VARRRGDVRPGDPGGPEGPRGRKPRGHLCDAGPVQAIRPGPPGPSTAPTELDGAERPLSALTDEELFDGLRQGDEAAFNALYERYFQRIYNFLFLRVRNHADAEELTQETFTAVFRSAEGFGGRSTPLAWIYGIAKNTVHNHLRRLRTHGQRLTEAGPEVLCSTAQASGITPEEQLSMDRYVALIEERLRKVSDWQAEVFFLRHVHNLPIREIARRMCRSSDAVRSGLYRVKRLLVEAGDPDSAFAP
jgi:RNA polymerase sigma-70 factor, ECF subfamily